MSSVNNPSFTSSVKGKVLIGFFFAVLALGISWFISNRAFNVMLNKLDNFSSPDDKLRLVNKVFQNILQLDHLQNAHTVESENAKRQFIAQSRELMFTLDTLSSLSLDYPAQIVRIDSIKRILEKREKIFENYVKVRSKLVSNKALSDEVKSISGIITTNRLNPDSTVVKTQKKTTTTTTITEIPDSTKKAEEKKGFLKRVFNTKKNKKIPLPVRSQTVQEVVNLEVDTLKVAENDSTIEMVGEAVNAIEKSQKVRTTRFVDREQELAIAGNLLVKEMLGIMKQVESTVVKEADEQHFRSREMVASSLKGMKSVMLGFLGLTVLLAYLIFADIARSNKYRLQLEEAKEEAEYHGMAKQRFLSNMSHEIRTPLQSIIGYTEALKKDEKPNQQDLNTLHSASEHLLYLVNEVLDYSRIISDQFTFEERTFSITPLLNEVVQMLRPTASKKGLVLTLENKLPAVLFLKGDPFRLRQILYNLLTNAIKFTETGDVILRCAGLATGEKMNLDIQVSDTGIGLSPEQAQRVFNQFEQADSSIARRFGGTGLGLSIVKALVEGMNGNIHVKSNPGKGTTFFIRTIFKIAETPPLALKEVEQQAYEVDGKVWLVDDDAFILKWCSSVLEMYDIEHTCFSSAEEAVGQPWDDRVRFVFTDMRMPGMNGAELCQRLRQVASSEVKFYVLTAQALPEERSKLLDMGFDGILMKPFHANELLELLQKYSIKKDVELPKPDFSVLNEMTFGDESILREILEQFVTDSRKDIKSLSLCVENGDMKNMHELMHRMAGRTGQIGAKELSAQFRFYEIAIRENKQEISLKKIKDTINQADRMVDQVGEKVLSYSI